MFGEKKEQFFRKLIYVFLFAILFVNIYRLYVEFCWDNVGFDDHGWIWNECRFAFWRYSPYQALANHQVIQGIHMEAHISTLPWGLFSGILIHGAFLPYTLSCYWYVCVRAVIVVATAICVWKRLEQEGVDCVFRFMAILAIPATWYAIDCISKGNNGGILGLLIIISVCILDRHPVWAGILLFVSMFKPQIAIPFFIVLLILKKYKTIAVSVAAVFISWGLGAWWTRENPLAQLQGVIRFANNMEASYHVVGIMDPIRKLGAGSFVAMLGSMTVGVLLLCVCMMVLNRRCKLAELEEQHIFLIYAFPAVTSVMWCYKSAQDYLILIVVVYAVLELWNAKADALQLVLAIVLIGMSITKPFSTALLGRLPMLDVYKCYCLDLLMKTMIMPILIWYYVRSER